MSVISSVDLSDLKSSAEKTNYDRIARLLYRGGKTLLKETFDSIHPPSMLPAVLQHPVTKDSLPFLYQDEYQRLYPSPGKYGKSEDFDITLLFKLLRSICYLPAPASGWNCCPISSDQTVSDDIARIRFYRNEICHTKDMEINDANFLHLWGEIRRALVRLAKSISAEMEKKWQSAIDNFLTAPLTPDDERNIHELKEWYFQDKEVKKELEEVKRKLEDMKVALNDCVTMMVVCGKMAHKGVEAGNQETPRCSPDDVLATIADKYVKSVNPSSPEEFKTFVEIMERLQLVIVGNKLGSLLITVKCNSLQILENLWKEYCSGHLGKMVQSCFASEYILRKFHLSALELKTTIRKEDYEACKQHFKEISGETLTPSVKEGTIHDDEKVKPTSPDMGDRDSMKEDVSLHTGSMEKDTISEKEEEKLTSQRAIGADIKGFKCSYDQKKLDLIIVVDCSTADIKYLRSLKSQLNKMIQICSNGDYDFRFALVDYWDQHAMTNYYARVQNFTRDVKEMKSYIKKLRQRRTGFMKGMAYGLAQVSSEDNGARSEAAKLCILLPVIDERKTLEVYKSTDGYDVMRLIRLLAENGFALYTVGIKHPLLCDSSDGGSQLISDFLTGISLKSGGSFIQVSSVTLLSEVVDWLVKEDIAVETLLGVVEDIIVLQMKSSPLPKQLSRSELDDMIDRGLRRRSCRTPIIPSQLAIVGPISQLAEKVSLMNDMASACDLVVPQSTVPEKPEKPIRQLYSTESSRALKKSGTENVSWKMRRRLSLRKVPYISEIAKYVSSRLYQLGETIQTFKVT